MVMIERIDIIVGTSDSKKNMPDLMVIRSNSFKDDYSMFDAPM
jgi:hypothetical protein